MANILIAYYYRRPYPPRASVRDHLESCGKYSGHRCFYANLGVWKVPSWLGRVPFDLIIFHTTFLSCRWGPLRFERLLRNARPLKRSPARRIALPQDEFVYSDLLRDFIREFQINQVFSPAPASQWPVIYDGVDRDRVQFFPVLTGYLDEATLGRIHALQKTVDRRRVDIGYRATAARAWLGRHGMLKTEVARRFERRAAGTDLAIDISTRKEDTCLGDDWFRFLLSSKYTLGVEGGSSLLDRDGSVRRRTEEFLEKQPDAGFSETQTACFSGLDGNLSLKALSPRHLEACATRTCQILVEGEYNGVLQSGRHYLAVKPDFSNVDQVLSAVQRDDLRQEMVDRAYQDIVASGRYSYRRFVDDVFRHALAGQEKNRPPRTLLQRAGYGFLWRGLRVLDRCAWGIVMVVSAVLARHERRVGRRKHPSSSQASSEQPTPNREMDPKPISTPTADEFPATRAPHFPAPGMAPVRHAETAAPAIPPARSD